MNITDNAITGSEQPIVRPYDYTNLMIHSYAEIEYEKPSRIQMRNRKDRQKDYKIAVLMFDKIIDEKGKGDQRNRKTGNRKKVNQ